MKTISLKNGILKLYPQATNIKLSRNKVNGTLDSISGFFTTKDNQVMYITQNKQPSYSANLDSSSVMYRTANNYKDYSGGCNTWDFSKRLLNHDVRV